MVFICDTCSYCTPYENNYKRHKKSRRHMLKTGKIKVKKARVYECSFCGYRGTNRRKMKRHFEYHVEEEQLDFPRYSNEEDIIKETKKMIDKYNEKKLDARKMFNFDYYYNDYYNLDLDDKVHFMHELVDAYNHLIMRNQRLM